MFHGPKFRSKMSQEITDAMLQARAIASASERYDKIMERDLWLAWKESHLAALEVEREAYLLLKECDRKMGIPVKQMAAAERLMATLRTRLGLTE